MTSEKSVHVFSDWKYNLSLAGIAIQGLMFASFTKIPPTLSGTSNPLSALETIALSVLMWSLICLVFLRGMPIAMKERVARLRLLVWAVAFFVAEIVGFFII